MASSQTILKKFKKFVNLKIFPGFKFLNLIFFSSCNKKLDAKKKYQRNWLERKLDEYNHTMELIRTILPFIILLIQIYILTKIT